MTFGKGKSKGRNYTDNISSRIEFKFISADSAFEKEVASPLDF